LVNFVPEGINAGVLTTQCCEAFLPHELKAKKKLKLEINLRVRKKNPSSFTIQKV
jgi:hypothetical protein